MFVISGSLLALESRRAEQHHFLASSRYPRTNLDLLWDFSVS